MKLVKKITTLICAIAICCSSFTINANAAERKLKKITPDMVTTADNLLAVVYSLKEAGVIDDSELKYPELAFDAGHVVVIEYLPDYPPYDNYYYLYYSDTGLYYNPDPNLYTGLVYVNNFEKADAIACLEALEDFKNNYDYNNCSYYQAYEVTEICRRMEENLGYDVSEYKELFKYAYAFVAKMKEPDMVNTEMYNYIHLIEGGKYYFYNHDAYWSDFYDYPLL